MSNPYGPHESADIVWQEKAILVGDAISLVAYGAPPTVHRRRSYHSCGNRNYLSTIYFVHPYFVHNTVPWSKSTSDLAIGLLHLRNVLSRNNICCIEHTVFANGPHRQSQLPRGPCGLLDESLLIGSHGRTKCRFCHLQLASRRTSCMFYFLASVTLRD